MAQPSILVTGAAGYLATHVVKHLLKEGHKVRGTVRDCKNETKVKPLYNLTPEAEDNLELVEADLLKAETWADAVSGCEYVIHVASPFPKEEPKHEDELIKPAVDGTLNVLKACAEVKSIKRVVLTSSVAAISGLFEEDGKLYTEKDWTIINSKTPAYPKSKTLAEKAAWDYVASLPDDQKYELVAICPTVIFGPVLCGAYATSMAIPGYILDGKMPMLPHINFPLVDVRDVALAHIRAMTIPEANGRRFIVNAHKGLWAKEMAEIMDAEFRPHGYRLTTRVAPNFFIKVYSWFDKPTRLVVPALGKLVRYDANPMVEVLGVQPHPVEETIIDMCYSMIDNGFAKKTGNYTGNPRKSSPV